MSEQTIRRLYAALDAHDGEAAAACYTDDAVFEDPAFGRLTGGAVKDMWRLLSARADDLVVELHECEADAGRGRARWTASYTYTQTGRSVVNDIEARFEFEGELIRDERDTFSLRRWGRQALGPRTLLLGLTPLLGVAVRRQARQRLDAYRARS
jgi:ketosteroid isomerase-like protein